MITNTQLYSGPKKKRTGKFLQNSQYIGPMNLKINIHDLNTHSFQHLKYKFQILSLFEMIDFISDLAK